ncbi:hypothetical protein Scep_002685 [Stephania cephalantha]|uniref:Uncharacterized protein n=1 Tax=Stephania cephalantha TaxID=152367 RepID=A0AAP0LFB0_9MAGN
MGNSSRGSLGNLSNWDCSSLALFSRVSGERVDDMDGFVRALAGVGWSVFKTKTNPSLNSGCLGSGRPLSLYLFRKIESNRVLHVRSSDGDGGGGGGGEFRIRELRLPNLDFRNAPLKILQYILLMTNDMFYLA